MALVLVTPPAVEPLTAAEVRSRLGLPDSISDAVLGALITSARQEIDGSAGWLGRALIDQTWNLLLDGFPCEIRLPLPPLQSVSEIGITDAEGEETIVAPSAYRVLPGTPARIIPARAAGGWPSGASGQQSVRVRFVAGYGAAGTDVPEPIRQAIVLRVGYLRSLLRPDALLRREEVTGVGSWDWTTSEVVGISYDRACSALLAPFRIF